MVFMVIKIYYCDKNSKSKSIHDEKYGEFTTITNNRNEYIVFFFRLLAS